MLLDEADLTAWGKREERVRFISGHRKVTTPINQRAKEIFTGQPQQAEPPKVKQPPIACTLTGLPAVVGSIRNRIDDPSFHAKGLRAGSKRKYGWRSARLDIRHPEDRAHIGQTIEGCVEGGDFATTRHRGVSLDLDTEDVELVIEDEAPDIDQMIANL